MTKAERELAARKHRCPKCNAQPYFSCVRYKGIRPISLKSPHPERIKLVPEDIPS
jgi:hypothetical protein